MFETYRILVLVDSEEAGVVVETELRRFGINCSYRILCDKKEFKELVPSFKPDIVISSYSMLFGAGVSTIHFVRNFDSNIPVIILVETINEGISISCMKEGVDYCIPRDSFDQLGFAVRYSLEKRAARREKEKLLHRLESRERYYRNILKYMHDEIVIIANDYTITDINNSVLAVTGRKREEILGKPCYKVFFNLESPCFNYGFSCYHSEVIKKGSKNRFQRKFSDKDGKEQWVDILVSPLFDEHKKVTHVIESFRNITDQVKAKEEVNKLSNAIEQSASAVIILNLFGEIEYCNPAFTSFSGYSKNEVLGKKICKLLGNGGAQGELENYREFLEKGDIKKIVRHNRRKDGSEYWVSANVSGLFDITGKLKGMIEVQEDITARLNYENQIKRDLEEKQELLHELYHRVNNNLQIVISLLNMHMERMANDEGAVVLRSIMQRFEAMAIIENTVYSVEKFINVDPGIFISDIFTVLTDSFGIPFGNITLRQEINVSGLNTKQVQTWALIINELFSNCIRHAFPDGKGEIVIKFYEDIKGGINLLVKDNGKGLPEGLDPRESDTVGFRLLYLFGEGQLQGTVEFKSNHGTEVSIVSKNDRGRNAGYGK